MVIVIIIIIIIITIITLFKPSAAASLIWFMSVMLCICQC